MRLSAASYSQEKIGLGQSVPIKRQIAQQKRSASIQSAPRFAGNSLFAFLFQAKPANEQERLEREALDLEGQLGECNQKRQKLAKSLGEVIAEKCQFERKLDLLKPVTNLYFEQQRAEWLKDLERKWFNEPDNRETLAQTLLDRLGDPALVPEDGKALSPYQAFRILEQQQEKSRTAIEQLTQQVAKIKQVNLARLSLRRQQVRQALEQYQQDTKKVLQQAAEATPEAVDENNPPNTIADAVFRAFLRLEGKGLAEAGLIEGTHKIEQRQGQLEKELTQIVRDMAFYQSTKPNELSVYERGYVEKGYNALERNRQDLKSTLAFITETMQRLGKSRDVVNRKRNHLADRRYREEIGQFLKRLPLPEKQGLLSKLVFGPPAPEAMQEALQAATRYSIELRAKTLQYERDAQEKRIPESIQEAAQKNNEENKTLLPKLQEAVDKLTSALKPANFTTDELLA